MSQNLESSSSAANEAGWGDVMEWLREQPEYSDEPAPSAAPQTETGKFLFKG